MKTNLFLYPLLSSVDTGNFYDKKVGPNIAKELVGKRVEPLALALLEIKLSFLSFMWILLGSLVLASTWGAD